MLQQCTRADCGTLGSTAQCFDMQTLLVELSMTGTPLACQHCMNPMHDPKPHLPGYNRAITDSYMLQH